MESRLRSVTEHVERVIALVSPLPVVSLDLADADGSILAEDLHALVSVPPFDSAAMDGYAVRLADLPSGGGPVTLQVTGDVAAGPSQVTGIGPGQAVRIMTGAPLPPGADAVVPVEHTSTRRFVAGAPRAEGSVTLARRPRPHVRAAGEDVRRGELLARAGTEVTAAMVGALAASGTVRVPVRRRPLVAVISTGSELVPVGGALGPGQITDSNGPMLAAAVRAAGADVVRLGPVSDDPAALRAALDAAVRDTATPDAAVRDTEMRKTEVRETEVRGAPGVGGGAGVDLIVTAGGVSAGAADVVREVLAAPSAGRDAAATDVDVATVAMSPGKPQALARWRGVPWLALPGNPVGAYASFELFGRPAIGRLRGATLSGKDHLSGLCCSASTSSTQSNTLRSVTLAAAAGWSCSPGRLLIVPVRLVPLPDESPADNSAAGRVGVAPTGSHHALSALAAADGLALVPPDVEKVRAGDLVQVLMLR
ncbi:molybdopterin molybdochelatase [Promicromonospora sp. AC04]|uniref:molybdopterin molybdotransferase MoeA n=1 Tax=Promicromonospora sp. AC04 TaxID=2135723 RepID=UPI000D339552|nr:molybdopterin molybdotransferase MoeA [Promicromonospora sp. AC04]PUB24023.1 molybdopterin molybdochelatase [Promicromonospora sp. AC04]